MTNDTWPGLPLEDWRDTYATLHMWTQIVGKVRLARTPIINHWWNVVLYVTPRGLTTTSIPHGARTFEIDFDFVDHELQIRTSNGGSYATGLEPRSVGDFYHAVMDGLQGLEVPVEIWTTPVEVDERIPFEEDDRHSAYDPEAANRLWRILVQTDRVMTEFRSRFLGKCSPVHFFWGAFDMAVTRFSGRPAPEHPGAPNVATWVVREAYSHECSSCGFWPGGGPVPEPVFYAYAYPEPEGFREWRVVPEEAYYSSEMSEFVLPYEAVRRAGDPDRMLLAFLQSTYQAAAELGRWDRRSLERAGQGGLESEA